MTSNDNVMVGMAFVDNVSITNRCVRSILPTLGPGDRLVLLDNGSRGGNVSRMVGLYSDEPRVDMRWYEHNVGMASAWNCLLRAFLAGEFEFLCLVHNDTLIKYPLWLTELKMAFANRPGKPTLAVTRSGIGNCAREQDHTSRLKTAFMPLREQTVKGYCMMLDRNTAQLAGPFDEGFVTMPDKDYQLHMFRTVPEARVVVCRDVFVDHLGNKTFSKLYSTTDFVGAYHADLRRLSEKYK